jgi:hypothetical protein
MAPLVLLIRMMLEDDAPLVIDTWQEFLPDRAGAMLAFLLLAAGAFNWLRPLFSEPGPLVLGLAGLLLLLLPRSPVLLGLLADPLTQVPLFAVLILPTLAAAAHDGPDTAPHRTGLQTLAAHAPALIAALLVRPEREALLCLALLHVSGSVFPWRKRSCLPAVLLLVAAGILCLQDLPGASLSAHDLWMGFLPPRTGGAPLSSWSHVSALLGPALLLGMAYRSKALRAPTLALPLAACFLLSLVVPNGRESFFSVALVATGLAVLTFLGLRELVRFPHLRGLACAAIALIVAVHGTRSVSHVPAMIHRDQERSLIARATVAYRFQTEPPQSRAAVFILGAPPYRTSTIRKHFLFPTEGLQPEDLGLTGEESRFLNWGPGHAFELGEPKRFRITSDFHMRWLVGSELTLHHPTDGAALWARSAEDEPQFQWRSKAAVADNNLLFYFFWIGRHRETGRYRAQMRELTAHDIVLQSGEDHHFYSWRPSIRPMHGEGKELLWEDEDLGMRGSSILWTVARRDLKGGTWVAPKLRSIWIQK